MTVHAPSALPAIDRALLQVGQRLVPVADRTDWLRSWQAELCYGHARGYRYSQKRSHYADPGLSRLAPGLLWDALELRGESWRRALAGTAILCLTLLSTLVLLAALPTLLAAGSGRAFALSLVLLTPRFAVESALILFVSYATAPTPIQKRVPLPVRSRLWARSFHASKLGLLLLLSFLLSIDVCNPMHIYAPFTAYLLQNFLFTLLALLALRWAFRDGNHRCKHCLRSLAEPARVGRPSHNFLEWNGTELLCTEGHGRLSVPEFETSWHQSSTWLPRPLA